MTTSGERDLRAAVDYEREALLRRELARQAEGPRAELALLEADELELRAARARERAAWYAERGER